jgi:hypothetical protein
MLIGIVVIVAGSTLPAVAAGAQDSGFALLIQSSPSEGGNVTPGDGVHRVEIGNSVPLIAVPKRGYRFLYWLGDVGQTDRTRTSVRMDSPKLVVAVFEREQFEDLLGSGIPQGASYGGLYPSQQPGSGGPVSPRNWTPDTPDTPDTPEKTPEPMSFLLLGLGAIAVGRMRK